MANSVEAEIAILKEDSTEQDFSAFWPSSFLFSSPKWAGEACVGSSHLITMAENHKLRMAGQEARRSLDLRKFLKTAQAHVYVSPWMVFD